MTPEQIARKIISEQLLNDLILWTRQVSEQPRDRVAPGIARAAQEFSERLIRAAALSGEPVGVVENHPSGGDGLMYCVKWTAGPPKVGTKLYAARSSGLPIPRNAPHFAFHAALSDDAFVGLLNMLMEADPWPYSVNRAPIEELLDDESRARGYCDWIEALHRFDSKPAAPEHAPYEVADAARQIREAEDSESGEPANVVTDEMVNRFLAWPLPKTFAPDAGISFTPTKPDSYGTHWWPVGTNLLSAEEARQMLEHVLHSTGQAVSPQQEQRGGSPPQSAPVEPAEQPRYTRQEAAEYAQEMGLPTAFPVEPAEEASDTPETDAIYRDHYESNDGYLSAMTLHARTLERQRNALQRRVGELDTVIMNGRAQHERLQRKLEAAEQRVTELVTLNHQNASSANDWRLRAEQAERKLDAVKREANLYADKLTKAERHRINAEDRVGDLTERAEQAERENVDLQRKLEVAEQKHRESWREAQDIISGLNAELEAAERQLQFERNVKASVPEFAQKVMPFLEPHARDLVQQLCDWAERTRAEVEVRVTELQELLIDKTKVADGYCTALVQERRSSAEAIKEALRLREELRHIRLIVSPYLIGQEECDRLDRALKETPHG